ncbi:P5-type ATPase cation transporter-domain-containing protein [Jimgerdemannia flammicorona]|uniref:Cation-transporting ATPase n=1 Tax=Jimgerdemannia flammicorona TaxID=994334 RepID=A0A433A323_9FUNG|nr:P5-type ATPase cation transporter-domain-containing protein [Jimgerdemannia flammicorona]
MSLTPIDTPKYATSAPPSPNSSLASTPTTGTFSRSTASPLTSRVPTKYGTPPNEPPGSPSAGSYPPSASTSAAPSPLLSAFPTGVRSKRHRRDSSTPLIGTLPIFNTDVTDSASSSAGFASHNTSEPTLYRRVSNPAPRPLSPDPLALGPLSPTPFTRGDLLSDKFQISNEADESGSDDESESDAAPSDLELDGGRPVRGKASAAGAPEQANRAGLDNGEAAPRREIRLDGFAVDPYFTLSRQTIHLPEEDLKIHLTGYHRNHTHLYTYHLIAFFTLGGAYLLARWLPQWWVRWVGVECPLGEANWIVIENQWGEITIESVSSHFYGGAIGSVFSTDQIAEEFLKLGPEPMSSPLLGEQRYLNPSEPLNHLHLLDHRYLRMAYHPGLRRFLQTGYWKDPAWTSAKKLMNGLTREQHQERRSVFGENLIDVKEKPTVKLLMDEVRFGGV